MTATTQNSSTGMIELDLDQQSAIETRLNKAIGILDVIGALGSNAIDMNTHSLNNATWAAKDLLKEALNIVSPEMAESGGAA